MQRSFLIALVLAAWSAVPASAADNLLRNGSFECGAKYWLEKFEVVAGDAPHGSAAARVDQYIRSAPFAVRVGQKVTIAFWAKADRPGPVGVGFAPSDRHWMREGGKPGFQAFFGTPAGAVELTKEWKRHAIEVTIPREVGDRNFGDPDLRTFFLVLGKPEKAGFALYDGVTVGYDGAGKEEYVPEAPVEVGVRATNLPGYTPHANIYPSDAEVKLTASVFNPSDAARSITLRWELLDYAGDRSLLPAAEVKLELPAGKTQTADRTIKLAGRGLQLVRATVLGGDGKVLNKSDQPVTCLAFPKSAAKFDPSERFGGTLVAGQPVRSHLVGTAQRIGLAWTRWYPQMNWQAVQPDGADDWKWPDEILDDLSQHGMGVNVVLYALPKWAKGKHPLLPKDMQDWEAKDPRWDDLRVVTSWDRYVTAVVQRYADRGFVWEVVNEPEFDHWDPAAYVKFFARTRKLVKAVDPKLKVVHGSVNGGPDGISREFLARGGADLCDVFCFHNYTLGEYLDGPGIRTMKGAFRAAGRKDGGPEVWMNEGWAHFPSSEDNRAATRIGDRTPAWVADTTVRCVADTFAAGMDKCIVFNVGYPEHGSSWWDWGGDGTAWYDNLSQPTVAVGAFNVLADQLGKCRHVATVRPSGAVLHIFHDDRHNRGVVVAWVLDKPRTLTLPAALSAIDLMGNPLSGSGEGDATEIAFSVLRRPGYADSAAGLSGDQLAKLLTPLGPKLPTLADRSFSPPKAWYNDGEFPNPFTVEDKPLWELGRIWPPQPDKAESYAAFPKWDAASSKWLDPQSAFGGNPAGVVQPDGQVTITAVGARKGGDHRAGALAFIAPANGRYVVTGRALTSRWEGTGEMKLDLVKLDDSGGTVEKITGWVLVDRKAHPFEVDSIELKAGQRLVFRFTIEAHNTQSGCTFEQLTVTRK